MKKLLYVIVAIAIAVFVVAFTDMMSLHPTYELRPAVIVKVAPDVAFGYIGEDYRTLVEFSDGFRTYVAGDIGDNGDQIMAFRKTGMTSIFGLSHKLILMEACK